LEGQTTTLQTGQRLGNWTLMTVVRAGVDRPLAVFEDFSQTNGHLLFADENGLKVDLPKSSEPTWADPDPVSRHRPKRFNSERDLPRRRPNW
jgi:hypothetical protein